MVVVLGCVRCRCGSSISCCGGAVCKCMYVVPASGGAWAFGGSVVPSRCFLGGQRFSFVRVAWSLGGLGFFVVLEVLFLLGGVWGLVFDESLGLVVSG